MIRVGRCHGSAIRDQMVIMQGRRTFDGGLQAGFGGERGNLVRNAQIVDVIGNKQPLNWWPMQVARSGSSRRRQHPW